MSIKNAVAMRFAMMGIAPKVVMKPVKNGLRRKASGNTGTVTILKLTAAWMMW